MNETLLARTETISALMPMTPARWRVVRRRRETLDTYTLELEPLDTSGLAFCPGQFNMLYVFGVGEVPISISGDPARPDRLAHTIRAVGAVSSALCNCKPGEVIGVRGPFGSAWPVEAAEGYDVVVMAGGIGLAPLRPAIYHLLQHRDRYGNLVLLYGARTPRDLLYVRELERWRGRFDVQVEVTVDHAGAGWFGHVGVVTTLLPRAYFDPDETVAFVCGPEIMMRFAAQALIERGVAPEHLYLSMERNMKCAIGLCGHCQFGPVFICKEGPVFNFARVARLLTIREC
ncbi:MAG: FAD/NAD(P)-binding protein [Rhodothermus sp.]|nr:FAD/NAD(P)-binding protein [Rhodothermus sp.]